MPGLRRRWSFRHTVFWEPGRKPSVWKPHSKAGVRFLVLVCWNKAPQDLRLESTDSAVQAVSRELITTGKRAAP